MEIHASSLSEFLLGLGILLSALILSCFLGQYQQITYSKYGRHWKEGMLYNHLLGLPAFALLYKDLGQQMVNYNESPVVSLKDVLNSSVITKAFSFNFSILERVSMPQMWFFLLLNVTTQCRIN
jgi:UDP-xylose/UDP-N-acetylglucosamine transporter B4